MIIKTKHFTELTTLELLSILKLRQEVFIIEQNCIYPDIDKYDIDSYHLICELNGKIIGTTRINKANTKYKYPSLGRICVDISFRKHKIGYKMIVESIKYIEENFSTKHIKISAQEHLESYYNKLGFVKTSEPYDDDGIMHLDMEREYVGA